MAPHGILWVSCIDCRCLMISPQTKSETDASKKREARSCYRVLDEVRLMCCIRVIYSACHLVNLVTSVWHIQAFCQEHDWGDESPYNKPSISIGLNEVCGTLDYTPSYTIMEGSGSHPVSRERGPFPQDFHDLFRECFFPFLGERAC